MKAAVLKKYHGVSWIGSFWSRLTHKPKSPEMIQLELKLRAEKQAQRIAEDRKALAEADGV
jgi:hypothetical protein